MAKKNADDHPIDQYIGKVLRKSRIDRKMSLDKLAKKVGICQQQLQKYEVAENRVSASKLERLAKALDIKDMNVFFMKIDT